MKIYPMSDPQPTSSHSDCTFSVSRCAVVQRMRCAVAALSVALASASCNENRGDSTSVLNNRGGKGAPDAAAPGADAGEAPIPPTIVVFEPVERTPVECAPLANGGARDDGDINVDLATKFQRISGFGGMNQPRWIPDLTPEQALTAFGDGATQLGLSLLRISVPEDPADFPGEVATAQRAIALGARVFASPWTPPPALKSNDDIVGGELLAENYGEYANHLLSYRDFMAASGVRLEAISIQNEPDIRVTYDSCDWTSGQMGAFLREQGPRFGDTRLIAAESYNFNRLFTDPLLNDPLVASEIDIVGGHIYGNGLFDYPLARELGKEVWMTEHYTDSGGEPDRANFWPLAYDVAMEIHDAMEASFNAYVWWYIRRGYGPITDDGVISKRGHLMAQFSRFIRPGFVRVAASTPPEAAGVRVTAYENGPGSVVVVVLNSGEAEQTVTLDLFGSCVTGFDRYTTSETKSSTNDGPIALQDSRATVTLDPQSVTTFVSLAPGADPPALPTPAPDAGAGAGAGGVTDPDAGDTGVIDAGIP
jgi:glucuronoarabinoxylan endo-1,4-beta-xylanase